ncbi:MAG: hypothetical protein WD016_03125 [Balneolaceae bacterium]
MSKNIDHISINDLFWIQIKSHLISFGFKGLPKGVHYTIGFDSRTQDVNLHVTKNHSDPKDKPQLKIVVIDKKLLEEIAPSLALSMLNLILKPLKIETLKTDQNKRLSFISFDKLQNSKLSLSTEQQLTDSFKDIIRFRKKTRLKIKGNIEQRVEKFALSEDLLESFIESLEELDLSKESSKNVEGGIILTDNSTINVIRVNNEWYTFTPEMSLLEFFSAFVNPRLARHLIWKTKRAIIHIKNTKNYSDTEEINTPIRLIKIIKK